MNRVFIGLPVDNSFEVGFIESMQDAIALDPDGTEGIASAPHIQPYRVTNQARNLLVAKMLMGDWTHILMLDSDMVFPRGLLGRLLSHDVDIIGAFYLRKVRGHQPCIMNYNDSGKPISRWPELKVEEVDAIGTGAILIRREVFAKMEPPWFYYKPVENEFDDTKLEQVSEDYVFCENAKKAGFKIHVDGSLTCGHVGQFVVWPQRAQGENSGIARISPFEPNEEELIYGH